MGFSRQEPWSRLPGPPPGGLPDQGSNLPLLHLPHWQAVFFTGATGKLGDNLFLPQKPFAGLSSKQLQPYLFNITYLSLDATVRTGHGTTDWFQIGKGVRQGCILSPCLFNLYAEYIMRNAGLEEAQARI